MILEGIVTTTNQDGSTNIAPMGPIVEERMEDLLLRPYQSSATYQNLAARGRGVFHITDDVVLIARAAIGCLDELPTLVECPIIESYRLADCCRWYAFRVVSVNEQPSRAEMRAQVEEQGRVRDFLGFNRAKHAVLEAAILATRKHLLPREEIRAEYDRLQQIVIKTAGPRETMAFKVLVEYMNA